jgi:hypothetical protein
MRHAVFALVFSACTPIAATPTSANICQARASLPADQTAIASVAAKNSAAPSDVQNQFVSACSAQIDNDIEQIEKDLLGIAADAGAQEKKP